MKLRSVKEEEVERRKLRKRVTQKVKSRKARQLETYWLKSQNNERERKIITVNVNTQETLQVSSEVDDNK